MFPDRKSIQGFGKCEPWPKMDACNNHTVHPSLEGLGISLSTDSHGTEQLTIDLDVDPRFGVAQCRAYFDEATRRWRLVTTACAKFANGDHASYPLRKNVKRVKIHGSPTDAKSNWTSILPPTPYVEFFKGVDWGATP